jgi:hypothetical protein
MNGIAGFFIAVVILNNQAKVMMFIGIANTW